MQYAWPAKWFTLAALISNEWGDYLYTILSSRLIILTTPIFFPQKQIFFVSLITWNTPCKHNTCGFEYLRCEIWRVIDVATRNICNVTENVRIVFKFLIIINWIFISAWRNYWPHMHVWIRSAICETLKCFVELIQMGFYCRETRILLCFR